jgi:CPA1 family monovalent cation:H+ antiporter
MEGESLLNDGVGVALFAVFSGIVTAQKNGGFFQIMLREIVGAVIVGTAVTWLCFLLFKSTEDKHRRIIITLFAVSASFTICEILGCSGAIACVVCGVVFSTLREKEEEKGRKWELEELDTFWETLDVLLNSALYVILGLSFVRILQMPHVLGLALAAIICNLASRAASLWAGSWLLGSIPDGYHRRGFIALFTWGGLRGGLSLALAVSTASIVPEETYVIILGCTYAIVFFTTVVQGLTMKNVFQRVSGKTAIS